MCLCCGVASLLITGTAALAGPQAGTWPMWRHDAGLTGLQPLPGAMAEEPRVLARYFVGARTGTAFFADLRGTGAASDFVIAARAGLTAWDASGRLLWKSAPLGFAIERVQWVEDLDGDGRNEVVAVAGHMGGTRMALLILDGRTGALRAAIDFQTGDFGWHAHCGAYLPGRAGRQIFIVTSMKQSRAETPRSNGSFELWSYHEGVVSRDWAVCPSEFVLYYPAVMVADLNGDGRMHAVINSWCHVWVLDLANGKVVSHAGWDPHGANVRHYGWNELIDVDGDGRLDYVDLSLTKHIDVLRNEGVRLALAWSRAWPDPVTTEARTIRYPSGPVVDLEGDGHLDVISAVFDSQADRHWRLSVFDAATGKEKATMADVVPLATVPTGERGRPRLLLCARSRQLEYDPPEAYEAWCLHHGAWQRVWSVATGHILFRSLESDDRHDLAFNSMTMRWPVTADVDGDGRPEFFTTSGAAGLQAWGLDHHGAVVAKPGSPPAPAERALPPGIPALEGVTVPFLLAAGLDGAKPNAILLYDNQEATVLRLVGDTLKRVDHFATTEIPIACDLMGDGQTWILTAGRGADGNLWVEPRMAGRAPPWHFVFPHSGSCGAYSERPHFLLAGHFTGGRHLDIFTYATKPAARTYLLDGRTGAVVWERTDLPAIERYFQPLFARAAAVDLDGDGADEVVFTNPDYYCVVDGRTGNLRVGPVEIRKFFNWWAAYASPAVLANPGGTPFAYLGGVYSSRGAIAADGSKPLWLEYLPTERWPLRTGNAGFNEGLLPPQSGRGWRAGQVEADGTLVCYDAENGRVAWRLPLAAATSGFVTGDVDGDGAAEFVLGTSDGSLLAVGDSGDHGRVVWRKHFDAPVGTPILADVNGDGKSEIVVSVADGWVYVLGR